MRDTSVRLRRSTLGDYLVSPVGKWVSGEGWIHFCATEPWLLGTIAWGHVDEALLDVILRCAKAANAAVRHAHAAFIDARRTTSYDPAIYAMGSSFLSLHTKELAKISRLAGVRSTGPAGALAEGFFRVVPPPWPVRVFSVRDEALDWIGCAMHARGLDEIEQIAGVVPATSRILGELHRALESQLARPDLERTSTALGLSVRSMQRHLRAEGTSFQREVLVLRVRVAQGLMLDTDKSLAEVALGAGFSSAAKLSAAFRKITGVTPTTWRGTQRSTDNTMA